MGFYLPGPNYDKADYLIREFDAEPVASPSWPPPEGKVFVCVVLNFGFEAAGIAFDQQEFEDFARPDNRPKGWLQIPVEKAIAAEPRVEAKLSLS